MNYCMKLRVRRATRTAGNILEACRTIDGIRVSLSGPENAQTIDSQEIVFTASNFLSYDEAWQFGVKLRNALILKTSLRSTGLDPGEDQVSNNFSPKIFENLEPPLNPMPIVRGLHVYEENDDNAWLRIRMTGSVSEDQSAVWPDIGASISFVEKIPPKLIEAAKVLAQADLLQVPSLKLVLSYAILDYLAEPIPWSESTKKSLGAVDKGDSQMV